MNPEDEFDLEHFLPYRISLLANTISQGIAAHYRDEHGISATEWRILAVLSRYPGSTASRISERTAMDKVAVHRGIKSLLAREFVERRTDEGDRRRRRLFITRTRGRAIVDDIVPRAREFERQLLDSLSPGQASDLSAAMDALQQKAAELMPG